MTDNENNLSQIVGTFFESGVFFDGGCTEDQIDFYIQKSRAIDPQKPACIIKDWIWFDVDVSDEDARSLSALKLHPAMIKSDFVIKDEAGRFSQGNWVRSSYLKEFHHNCLFETQNTIYLLVGTGTRKTASIEQISRLF